MSCIKSVDGIIDLTGQLSRDVIGRLSVKPWRYWLRRLVMSLVRFVFLENNDRTTNVRVDFHCRVVFTYVRA